MMDRIAILDFGAQYTQLIARRVREQQCFAEIVPATVSPERVRADGVLRVVVEAPKGSTVKLTYDPELRTFCVSRGFPMGTAYPYDWGFIPSTKAEDGDPLDVLVIHDAGTYPGLALRCRPIGVLEVLQNSNGKKERNDRENS
jgi:inorganic pyrophosphatase